MIKKTNMNDPKVAVVVLNWNGFSDTVSCIESLLAQNYANLEIHLLDNGSENDEAHRLETEFGSKIILHRTEKNLGFTGGNNLVIEEILKSKETAYVALLNNDAIAHTDWVSSLVRCAGKSPKIGVVASMTLFFDQPDRIENAGVDILSTGDAVPRGRNRRPEFFSRETPLLGASASAVLYSCGMLRQIGIFRCDFFANFEDVDLSLRAITCGWDCIYAPGAKVSHKLNQSIRKVRDDSFHIRSLRNLAWASLVNLPLPILVMNLPWAILRDLFAICLAPLFGQKKIARIIWHARRRIWRERGQIIYERHRLDNRRRSSWWWIWLCQKSFLPTYLGFFWQALVLRRREFMQ